MTDFPMPQPTKEHLMLAELAGTWNVECKYFMDPTQPPMETNATDTAEMLGQFWMQSRFECDMFGSPFTGVATLGYDVASEQWVSTWIDTMSSFLFHFTGNFDESGKVLKMAGTGPSPMTGEMRPYRTVETVIGPDERTFEMYVDSPDGEMKMFEYTYRRASS